MRSLILAIIVGSIAFIASCKKDDDSGDSKVTPPKTHQTTPYVFNLPDHFPRFFQPKFNEATVEGVVFGKRLYYDQMLSLGGPLEGNACASCHAHPTNFSNNATGISVMPHTNLHWTSQWLWNGGKEGSLEEVMEFEIVDFFQANIDLFKEDTTYQRMCYEAFGTEDISAKEMAWAMSQWVRTMLSTNSKFDRFFEGKEELTPLELRGQLLFNSEAGDCFHCHSTPLTTDLLFHNNGLDSVHTGFNLGRYNVTKNDADKGLFKTPNLRNLEHTAPYMHDGRFATLEEVVEFYNSGVKLSHTLDPIMTKEGKENGLNLSEYDKMALVAFLKTLTDDDYLKDEKYNSPFE